MKIYLWGRGGRGDDDDGSCLGLGDTRYVKIRMIMVVFLQN